MSALNSFLPNVLLVKCKPTSNPWGPSKINDLPCSSLNQCQPLNSPGQNQPKGKYYVRKRRTKESSNMQQKALPMCPRTSTLTVHDIAHVPSYQYSRSTWHCQPYCIRSRRFLSHKWIIKWMCIVFSYDVFGEAMRWHNTNTSTWSRPLATGNRIYLFL